MVLWNVIFWAVLIVLLICAEIGTTQLVAVWFAAGGIIAFIASLFGAPFYVQIIFFILGSILLLVCTRPIVRRFLRNTKKVATNSDRVVGQECVVQEEINNALGTGRVRADGMDWTARSADDQVVCAVGTVCTVQEIQGVKLIVRPGAASAQP